MTVEQIVRDWFKAHGSPCEAETAGELAASIDAGFFEWPFPPLPLLPAFLAPRDPVIRPPLTPLS